MLTFLLSILPATLSTIVAVENAVKATGPTKKNLVLTAIVTAAQLGEQIPQPQVAAISALIDNLVSILNQSGTFKSSQVTAGK